MKIASPEVDKGVSACGKGQKVVSVGRSEGTVAFEKAWRRTVFEADFCTSGRLVKLGFTFLHASLNSYVVEHGKGDKSEKLFFIDVLRCCFLSVA